MLQRLTSAAVRHSRLVAARAFGSAVPEVAASAGAKYNTLLTEMRGNVALITLNRPKALNALCDELIAELNTATSAMDKDPAVKAIVITGSERAFAAGADITEMCERDYMEAFRTNMFEVWGDLARIKTPTIAAVRGFALGGGCELAMTCDIMIAGACRKAVPAV
jgi:enoyl-CoA hydratase/carnithine racemase